MKDEKEKLKTDLEDAQLKLTQAEHRVQVLENQKKFLTKKENRQRTHHLCNRGGAVQNISKDADALTKMEFFLLMEQIFLCQQCRIWFQKQKENMTKEERFNGVILFPCRSGETK